MELQVIQSILKAEDSIDNQPHPRQRAYPVPELQGNDLDALLKAIKVWYLECERIDREGTVRGTVNGAPVEFKAPAPVFGSKSKTSAEEVVGLIKRALPLLHNPELKASLIAEFGKPTGTKPAPRAGKALDLTNIG